MMASSGSRPIDILRMRWRSLFRRARFEDELDDELRFHFECVVEQHVKGGLTESEARRRARLEHGGTQQLKEECREMRGISLLENIGRDVGYALRGFRRDRLFTIIAVATIALGVGMNTAIFSLLYSVFFRPLPVRDPSSVRNVYMLAVGEGQRSSYGGAGYVSFPELNHIRKNSRTADVAGCAIASLSWKGHAEPLRAQMVSHNLLSVLGAKPVLGRFFGPEEVTSPGSASVVVLSHIAWQRHFGGAQDVVGRPMILNRTLFTVIGVADEKTSGAHIIRPDVWIPATMQALTRPGESLITDPNAGWLQMIGRRKPGFTDAEMTSEMTILGQQSLLEHGSKRTARVTVVPGAFLNDPTVGSEALPVARILFLAISLVLVVACANVANMLLARGLSRWREIAIRLSIGSGRARLIQQLLVESTQRPRLDRANRISDTAGHAAIFGIAQTSRSHSQLWMPSFELFDPPRMIARRAGHGEISQAYYAAKEHGAYQGAQGQGAADSRE
jgi:macrolide transport system ATP-binding/permease protein